MDDEEEKAAQEQEEEKEELDSKILNRIIDVDDGKKKK